MTIYRFRFHLTNDLVGSDHIFDTFDSALLFYHNFRKRHGEDFHRAFLTKMTLRESTGEFVPVSELKFV